MKLDRLMVTMWIASLAACGERATGPLDPDLPLDLSTPAAIIDSYEQAVNDGDCDLYAQLIHVDFELIVESGANEVTKTLAMFCREPTASKRLEIQIHMLNEAILDGGDVEVIVDAVAAVLSGPDDGWLVDTRLRFLLATAQDGTYRIRSIAEVGLI